MTLSLADLRPGDIGFGPIKGGAGALVNAGQLILGEGFRVGKLDIRHVFVVVDSSTTCGPWVVEAMPSGARRAPLNLDRWTPEYAYVRLKEDYLGQASDAAAIAKAMIGTPYSFASYLALAAWRFGLRVEKLEAWIDRRRPGTFQQVRPGGTWGIHIALPREAICSVLADQAWTLAGKKVMEGVAHQCVTPGALAARLLQMGAFEDEATWMFPGQR